MKIILQKKKKKNYEKLEMWSQNLLSLSVSFCKYDKETEQRIQSKAIEDEEECTLLWRNGK